MSNTTLRSLERKLRMSPKAQPRPKATVVQGHARIYNPKSADDYKTEVVKLFARIPEHFDEGTPLRVTIDYFFIRPQSLERKRDPDGFMRHTKKPDLDNLNKAVLDAIGNSGLWHDDRQVCELRSRKFYTRRGGGPLVRIVIEELEAC